MGDDPSGNVVYFEEPCPIGSRERMSDAHMLWSFTDAPRHTGSTSNVPGSMDQRTFGTILPTCSTFLR
jgi:hypothetical protein